MGLSAEELRNIETQTLVDRLPFDQLAQAIKAGIVEKDVALKLWQNKIDALHKQLSSNYYVNQQGLQKLKTEVPKKIEEALS